MIFLTSYTNEDNGKTSLIYLTNKEEYVVVTKDKNKMNYVTFSSLKIAEDYAEEWTIKNE